MPPKRMANMAGTNARGCSKRNSNGKNRDCALTVCIAFFGCIVAGCVLLPMGLIQHGDASVLSPLDDFDALGKVCNITRLSLCMENVGRDKGHKCQFTRTFSFHVSLALARVAPLALHGLVEPVGSPLSRE